MAKTASSIAVRDTHRREYRRTMNRIVALSVIAWLVLTIWLGPKIGGGGVVAMSAIMAVGLLVTRITLWARYRRDMRAELAARQASE